MITKLLIIFFFLFSNLSIRAEAFWLDQARLKAALEKAAQANPDLVKVSTRAQTLQKNDIWLVEIGKGKGPGQFRPALLVVAGIEGNELASTQIVVDWIASLPELVKTNSALAEALERSTLYIFPRVNPDASASYFATPRFEAKSNLRPWDDDRDAFTDEDGPDDLNGDGLITFLRIEDGQSDLNLDPVDQRLMVKADRPKGEKGGWKMMVEGRDNDGDQAWNEDGIGGVSLNENFPLNYRFFAPGSGLHQMSEIESRVLADFIVDHPEIAVVFTFGASENLWQTPKAQEGQPGPRRPAEGLHRDDVPYYAEFGKLFRESLGLKGELKNSSQAGSFPDWIYYHRGRLSLAARPWSPALALEFAKLEKAEKEKAEKEKAEKEKAEKEAEKKSENAEKVEPAAEKKQEDKPGEKKSEGVDEKAGSKKEDSKKKNEDDKRNEEERAFLKWAAEQEPVRFLDWKDFEHPDFPKQKVQIGGWAPFAKTNPPEKHYAALSSKYQSFLSALPGKLPRLEIASTTAKHLGQNLFELVVTVKNSGYLPSVLGQGGVTREVLPTRVELDLEAADVLSGAKRARLNTLEGSGGVEEVRWVIQARDKKEIKLRLRAAFTGEIEKTISLPRE